MKCVLGLLKNSKFWIVVQSINLIWTVIEFLTGKEDWKQTMYFGALSILMIGVDRMFLEKEKEEVDK